MIGGLLVVTVFTAAFTMLARRLSGAIVTAPIPRTGLMTGRAIAGRDAVPRSESPQESN
jgi:hypothetical protein